jgi:isoquinoline 1-oxidoreductase alpha subunit
VGAVLLRGTMVLRGESPTANHRQYGPNHMSVAFTLNGKAITLDADPDMPLLWAIREGAGLHGTKYGCGIAQCGACTVHIERQAARSCITPLSAVAGQHVTAIEGIGSKAAKAVQAAWVDLQVPQCGYCQSGQIMSATALLEQNPKPNDADINDAMRRQVTDPLAKSPCLNSSRRPVNPCRRCVAEVRFGPLRQNRRSNLPSALAA